MRDTRVEGCNFCYDALANFVRFNGVFLVNLCPARCLISIPMNPKNRVVENHLVIVIISLLIPVILIPDYLNCCILYSPAGMLLAGDPQVGRKIPTFSAKGSIMKAFYTQNADHLAKSNSWSSRSHPGTTYFAKFHSMGTAAIVASSGVFESRDSP